jgi:uracil-DNA glycosylase
VLTVGSMAAREVLGLRRLGDCVGTQRRLGDALAIPLPHPSGASGWLNDAANRALLDSALGLVKTALSRPAS